VETFSGIGTAGSADATGTAASYNGPWGISTDALGNLYHADYTGKRIRRTTPAGVASFIDSFSSFSPIATAIDPATGTLYVSVETHRILRYVNNNAANYPAQAPVYGPGTDFPDATIVYAGASTSGSTNASGTSARFNAPHGLHARGGFLYVADKGNNLIRKIDLSNAAVTTVTVTGGTLSAPEAVWVAEDGTIYVACTGSDLIQKIAPDGALSTVAGSVAGNVDGTGTAASFNDPRGLAMNGRGELLVADSANHAIRRISPNGAVRTIAGGSASGAFADGAGADARFSSPRGVVFGGDGLLYIADHGNHRIRRMNVMQPLITGAPASLAAFTADSGNSSAVQSFTFAGTLLEGPVTITAPTGFEVSTDGISYAASVTSNEGATVSIRLAATAATGSLAGNLTLSSAQADTINIALSGQVAVVLQPSEGTLTGFSSTLGGTSAAQSFSLTGRGLNDVVKVTVPAGYEISTDGLNFASAATLGGPAGTIQSVLLDAAGQNNIATGALHLTGSGNQFPNQGAFAALKSDGSVVAWGNPFTGGDSSSVAASLSSGVTAVYSNQMAFAALKSNGSVVTWGNADFGGDSSVVVTGERNPTSYTSIANNLTSNVTAVYSTQSAFAALKNDGSVITWGNAKFGGNSSVVVPSAFPWDPDNYTSIASNLTSNVTTIFSNQSAFAALKSNGSVVTWGDSLYGGNSSSVANSLSSGVKAVYSTGYAFAALKNDGSVVTWGQANSGGDSSSVANSLSSGVTAVYSNESTFAALKNDGSVITWGSSNGGDSSSVANSLSSGVTAVYSTGYAFAALKIDGSVVTWGHANSGGNSSSVASSLSSGVTAVYSNPYSFAALKNDGSVITWGEGSTGGNSSGVANSLSSGVTAIFSGAYAFAALKNDGSVVTWGEGNFGGNSSSVATSLSSGVVNVYSTQEAFAALKSDGSVITWGEGYAGGSGGPANIGGGVPPTLPLTLHVRLAATAPLGAVTGNLTISSTDATTQTVVLSGTVNTTVTYTHQELWRFANFGSYTSANSGADSADPDGDGMSNLLEYALGTDPNNSGVMPAVLALNGANLEYTYTRSTAAKDNGVTYQIEWSDTLAAGSWSTETVTQEITSTQGALETVKASVPKGTGGKRFLRLKVQAVSGN
jgi:alpha-tubulin suppressor-like RCC1 family protein